MVPIDLIIYAIRAGIRLARAADNAVTVHFRDRPIVLPSAQLLVPKAIHVIDEVFGGDEFPRPEFRDCFSPELIAELRPLWTGTDPSPGVPDAEVILHAAALQAKARTQGAASAGLERIAGGEQEALVAAMRISQWREDSKDRPLKPAEQFAVAFVDIGLEFIAGNPGLLGGIGGRGEKLIAGFAAEVSRLIPDDLARLGPREGFALRLAQLMLRAGLTTLTQQSALLISKEQYRDLLRGVTEKLVAAMPTDVAAESRWWDQAETLVPAIADEALRTIASRPGAFFGDGFEDTALFGALAGAVLTQAAAAGSRTVITSDGLIGLYRAAIGVVAERPDLLAKLIPDEQAGVRAEKVAEIFIGKVAAVLKDARPPFNGALGLALAKALLDSSKAALPLVFRQGNMWEEFASGAVATVIGALTKDIGEKSTTNLTALFSERQLAEFAAVFLRQASQSPEMLIGDMKELGGIVAAVAAAAADAFEQRGVPLLSADDWLKIAAAAVAEASANPGRLFGLRSSDPRQVAASQLIGVIVGAAAAALPKLGRERTGVVIGATLREIIIVTLEAASGNLAALLRVQGDETWTVSDDALAALKSMIEFVIGAVRAAPAKIGAAEALRLYRALLPDYLASGKFTGKDRDGKPLDIEKLIRGDK